ncbi:MAG TPA: hypothetical protein PK559_10530 [Ignavibacteriaceae bacterium]|nr:hypothetical protein [Ignavibacteriaceae bacterium]
MNKKLFGLLAFITFCTSDIYAEVMDKEPSYSFIWGYCLIALVLAYFIYKYHYYFAFIFLPVSLIFPIGWISELNDKYVGPAIMQEAGILYFINIYLSTLFIILFQVFLVKKLRKTKKVKAT